MWNNFKYYRSVLIIAGTCCVVFILSRCMNSDIKQQETDPTSFTSYTTQEKCITCHKEIYDSHIKTAHYLTGRPASAEFIKGSFENGKNTYAYTPDILLKMEKRDSGFYQVAFFKGQEKKAMRFDMVTGSGVMGQSFLNWRGNKLFQLPITYFTAANQWSNSPGFPSQKVMIDRPVTARCLECHITYAEGISGTALEPDAFNPNTILYGVDCQKCHGPAAKHVEYHTEKPEIKLAKFIINPSKLNRQQQMDVCANCHSGNIQKTKPSFEFTAGKNLSDYFKIDSLTNVTLNSNALDVHGNQVGLLKASKCYRMTDKMTCSTCHNTHENQRGNTEVFSQKCISCHNTADEKFKTATHASVNTIERNCIDCHMPSQPSKSIAVFLQGEETPKASSLRTHYIGIYPGEIKKNIKANK
jgi:hypothetical protein